MQSQNKRTALSSTINDPNESGTALEESPVATNHHATKCYVLNEKDQQNKYCLKV